MPRPLLRRQFLHTLGALAVATPRIAAQTASSAFHDVRRYGAKGDGTALDTGAIQSAIDACSHSGGGTVLFPAGTYRSGTLDLKSHVTLQLEAGATLRGSASLADYPSRIPALRSYTDTYTEKSLIYAENIENIAICGQGAIDGQGSGFHGPYKVRPYLMRFVNCRDVSVTGITIRDSPMWVQHYLACERVDIRGITVHSRVNQNNDGIDIDSCAAVRISDCDIWSGDDAIVLKATLDRVCRDVVVSNCILSSACNALKLGTESNGGFENIAFSNCTIRETRLAGLAIEMVDGGLLDRITVTNLAMNGVGTPIFVRLGNRARPFVEGGAQPPMGSLRNVSISNLQADVCGKTGCAIAGLPGHRIENLSLDNIRLSFVGGGKAADARRTVPEQADRYPEHSMFGALPAYGFYCRHASNVRFRNIETTFTHDDERPGLLCDDVEDLEIADSAFATAAESDAAIRLLQVQDAFIHGCRTHGPVGSWLRVAGDRCRSIRMQGNFLTTAKRAIEKSAEVPDNAIEEVRL